MSAVARFFCISLLLSTLGCALNAPGSSAALGTDGAYVASLDGWSVTAGTPTYVGEGTIQGSFTFTHDSGTDATRGGGACLIAHLATDIACDTWDDCFAAQAQGLLPQTGADGWLYCAGVNGFADKSCWIRPADYCTRSPSRDPGTYLTPTAPVRFNDKVVDWITLACLAVPSNPHGCAYPSQHVYATSYLLGDEQ
jgi:hypothetical protein